MQVRTRTWFAFVVMASMLFLVSSRFAFFDPLENAVQSTVAPVEAALGDLTQPLADFVNNLTDINRLTDDNQALSEENERLRAQVARLQESDTELQQLKQLLNVRTRNPNDTFVDAEVFAREPSNLKDMIAINRGQSDGVEKGMVVLTRQGTLLGSVTSVLDDVAWVTLIIDPSSAVSATVQASRVQGVVAGSTEGSLTMEFVERTADVKEGDLVITSGVAGNYPPGEVIGAVVNVERQPQELFQSVHVEPLADLSRLEGVLVLTSFRAADAGTPP